MTRNRGPKCDDRVASEVHYYQDQPCLGGTPFGIVQNIKRAFEGRSKEGKLTHRAFSRFHNVINIVGMYKAVRCQLKTANTNKTGVADTLAEDNMTREK